MKKVLSILLSGILVQNALACTALSIQAKDGTTIAGRTMEWAYPMNWKVLFYPKGSSYQLIAPDSSKLPPVTMTSKYAIIGVGSGLANDAMLEGQNSAGLGISGNFLPGFTQFPTVTHKDKYYMSVLEFTRFVLSNYATVAEAQKDLPKYKVWEPVIKGLPARPTIHFMLTDKSDASIVIEFINGEMKIFTNTANVMTNSPNYDWHLTNLRNYVNLGNIAVTDRTSNRLGSVTSFGQGGGAIGLPGDYTPPSRFVKTAFLAHYADKPEDAAQAISQVDHILNNVDIPKGAVVSMESNVPYSDYTQWVALKDLNHNQFYIANYDHRTNFAKIDFNSLINTNKPLSIEVDKIVYPTNDITTAFAK